MQILFAIAMQTRAPVCGDDYVNAQLERRAGHLLAAREALARCGSESCPVALAKDCRKWCEEVDALVPSVVFEVRDPAGTQATRVRVTMDDKPIVDVLDGRAIPVDPGRHRFGFVIDGIGAREREVIVLEGVKAQKIEASFEVPKPKEPLPLKALDAIPPRTARPVPIATWVFGGMTLVAALNVAVFGTWSLVQENDLRSSCAPLCSPGQRDEVRAKQIVADASLLTGIVTAAMATLFYLARPTVLVSGRTP